MYCVLVSLVLSCTCTGTCTIKCTLLLLQVERLCLHRMSPLLVITREIRNISQSPSRPSWPSPYKNNLWFRLTKNNVSCHPWQASPRATNVRPPKFTWTKAVCMATRLVLYPCVYLLQVSVYNTVYIPSVCFDCDERRHVIIGDKRIQAKIPYDIGSVQRDWEPCCMGSLSWFHTPVCLVIRTLTWCVRIFTDETTISHQSVRLHSEVMRIINGLYHCLLWRWFHLWAAQQHWLMHMRLKQKLRMWLTSATCVARRTQAQVQVLSPVHVHTVLVLTDTRPTGQIMHRLSWILERWRLPHNIVWSPCERW